MVPKRHGRTNGRTDDMQSHNRALPSIARLKVSHLGQILQRETPNVGGKQKVQYCNNNNNNNNNNND